MADIVQVIAVALSDAQHLQWEQLQWESISLWYKTADPLISGFVISLLTAAFCWIMSILSWNYSWVDRFWSIMPIFYAWHFALHSWFEGTPPGLRLIAMTFLATVWGVRLTVNFARKGGYTWSSEDHRWPVLRTMMHWTVYQIFNVVFIALYQNLLIYAITLPAYVAWRAGPAEGVNILDFVAFFVTFGALVLETVADDQQWTFQSEKYRRKANNEKLEGDYARGFLTSGLFRYSRHPNFLGEMTIWWGFYLFSVAATGEWLNWSITGTVLLTLLFQGSTWFTEKITLSKYPAYKEYQKTTSRLLLLPPKSKKPQKEKRK